MLYGLEFASVGLSTLPKDGKGYQEIIADPRPRTYQKVILKDGVPVGMLALGDRRSVLTFKRAIDAQVNVMPVAARLFAPDFKFGEWLDRQGVPPPILSVSKAGAVKKVAYADTDATFAFHMREASESSPLLNWDAANRVPVPTPSRLSLLNDDGSLTIPGTTNTIPADLVTTLKERPALIVIVQGNSEVFS